MARTRRQGGFTLIEVMIIVAVIGVMTALAASVVGRRFGDQRAKAAVRSIANLMQLARSARDEAARVFVAHDVGDRAGAVRRVLNQLGPYYDPDFPTLAPHPNIEPGATR